MKNFNQFLMLSIGACVVIAVIWMLSKADFVSPGAVITIAILLVVVVPAVGVILLDRKSRQKTS